MLLSFRPLVSVSVVTVLGWCWYSFRRRRRRRRPAPVLTEEECFLDEKSKVPCPADSCMEKSNLKADRVSRSPDMSNPKDTSSTLPNGADSICVMDLTNVVRPEPEGEVSIRTIISKGLPYCGKAGEDDSGLESDPACLSASCSSSNSELLIGKQSGPVHSDSHDGSLSDSSVNQDDMEKIGSCLAQQVIAGEKLKNQGLCELGEASRSLEDGLQDPFQQKNEHSDDCSSKDLHPNIDSIRETVLSNLGSSIGDDSGCVSCSSEDVLGTDGLTSKLSEDVHVFTETPTGKDTQTTEVEGFSSTWKAVERADEACNVISSPGLVVENFSCVSAENLVNASSYAPPPAPPIIMWDIKVPAHLVGRLIGKQGRFVNFMKQSSGARIYVSTLPFTQDVQICHIQGSQQQVDDALELIRKKFKDLDLRNCIQSPCLTITSWLFLPQDVFVEVIVSWVESGHHLFIQQYHHPSYQALPSLKQHMQFCYSHPGCPSLPNPVEVGIICAAPISGNGWHRAQIIQYDEVHSTAHIKYVDIGGYDTVHSTTLRQLRSDFVTLPLQASEVLLNNIAPLPGEERFSPEAKAALEELTANVTLILKVTGFKDGLPLVHMWKQMVNEVVLVNKLLVDRGVCTWIDAQ